MEAQKPKEPIDHRILNTLKQLAFQSAYTHIEEGIRDKQPHTDPIVVFQEKAERMAVIRDRFEDRVKKGDPFLALEVILLEAANSLSDERIAREYVLTLEETRIMWANLADRIPHENSAELMVNFLEESYGDKPPYVTRAMNPTTNQMEILALVQIAAPVSPECIPSLEYIETVLKKLCVLQSEQSLVDLEQVYDDRTGSIWRSPLFPTSSPDMMVKYYGSRRGEYWHIQHNLLAFFTPKAIEEAISFTK